MWSVGAECRGAVWCVGAECRGAVWCVGAECRGAVWCVGAECRGAVWCVGAACRGAVWCVGAVLRQERMAMPRPLQTGPSHCVVYMLKLDLRGPLKGNSHSRGLQISLLSYASGSFGGLKYSSMVSSGELEGVGRGVGVVVVTASGCALASWS